MALFLRTFKERRKRLPFLGVTFRNNGLFQLKEEIILLFTTDNHSAFYGYIFSCLSRIVGGIYTRSVRSFRLQFQLRSMSARDLDERSPCSNYVISMETVSISIMSLRMKLSVVTLTGTHPGGFASPPVYTSPRMTITPNVPFGLLTSPRNIDYETGSLGILRP